MAKPDPYLAFADPVEPGEASFQPAQQGMGRGQAFPPSQTTPQADDPYAAIAEPAAAELPADQSTETSITEEPVAVSRMSPGDEAKVRDYIAAGDADGARAYAAGKGFQLTNADRLVQDFKQFGHIGADSVYELAKVETGAGDALGRGALDTILLGTPQKLGAVVAGTKAALSGGEFGTAYDQMLDANNATIGADERDHPWMRLSGQLLGGLAIPTGLEGVGLKAGSEVLRMGGSMQEARAAATIAVRNRMAAVGGVYGTGHGAGSADTIQDAAAGAAVEGTVGAATGGLFGQVSKAMAPKFVASAASARAAPMTEAEQVARAASRQGLDVLPADVGGPVSRGLTAATAQTPLGVVPIARGAQQLDEQAATRVAAISDEIGKAAADSEGIGTAATEGALKYASAAKKAGGRLYDAAAAKAGDAQIDLQGARDVLDQQIARLKAVPGGGAGLKEAEALRASLDKPYPVQGVRDMRTENFVAPDFRGTPVEARMKAVTNAAADDIVAGLRAQGKSDAAEIFRAADKHWRETLSNLKRNIEPIIGKLDNLKSPEAVASALNSAMKNNGSRVGKFINSLPSEQQGVVRASMLQPLGRDKDGIFSIARFATDWNALSPAAKRAVFGPEARAALDDLALVGSGAKQAAKYANHSNTARAVIADRMLGTLGTGATIGVSLKTFGLALGAQYGMGRLLASPRFARWLARSASTSLSAPAYLDRLGRIARAEPAIANEVLSLQKRLVEALSSPARLAADERDNEGRRVDTR